MDSTALIVPDTAVAASRPAPPLNEQQRARVHSVELDSLQPSTRAAYLSDKRVYEAWLAETFPGVTDGAVTTIEHALAWLESLAARGLTLATIKRRRAMLVHLVPGLRDAAPECRPFMRGMANRLQDFSERGRRAFTWDQVAEAVTKLDNSMDGELRRAVLVFGVRSGMRRSELARLTWTMVDFRAEGLLVTLRMRTKTGGSGPAPTIALNKQLDEAGQPTALCPMTALARWKTVSAPASPDVLVFRHVSARTGEITEKPVLDKRFGWFVSEAAASLGLSTERIGAHSLRVGLVTCAVEAGHTLEQVMRVSRHKSHAVASGYIRHGGSAFQHGL